jgi:signal transduction histidine kinase
MSDSNPLEAIHGVLSEHKAELVDLAHANIRAAVPHYAAADATELREGLELLLENLLQLIASGDPEAITFSLFRMVADRIEHGLSMGEFLLATLCSSVAIRTLVTREGLPYEPVELVMFQVVTTAGGAYSEVYSKKLMDLERQRVQATSEVDRLRAISDMVAGVAHEVNTPLGIMNQAASFMKDALPPDVVSRLGQGDEDDEELLEDVAEAAGLVCSNVERTERLVSAFKNLSVQQVTDDAQDADLAELVREAVVVFRTASSPAPALEVEVVDRTEGRSGSFHGFPSYTRQVLVGLLANASRHAYAGKGGAVQIALEPDGDERLVLSVTDHGVGISDEDLSRVFDPFFTTARNAGNVGLGLAIAHNLVTGPMQGSLRVESRATESTCFFLGLPWTTE